MKHKLALLLCVLVLISLPTFVMAQGVANHQQNTTSPSTQDHSGSKGSIDGAKEGSKGIIGKQMDAYYENPDNQPGLFERSISDVLIGTANFLIQSFGMKDVTLLVFNKNPNPTSDGFLQGNGVNNNVYLGVFSEGMMSAIDALYSTFEHFMPYPVVIIVLVLAFLTLWNSTQAEKRSQWKDYVTAFLVALLSIRFGYYLWKFVATTSQYFTDMIWDAMVRHGVQPDLFLNMIWGTGAGGYGEMIEYRGFVVGVLVLLAACMTAIINYQYTMRTIMLMILIATFVPACVLTIFPKFRHSLQTWWDLFISYMLMPCGHAVALGLFFLLMRYSSDGVSNWIIVAYLFGFSTIHTVVSKLIGGQEQQRSGMGSMFGVGSMMALGRMFSSKGESWGRKGKQQSGTEAEQANQAGSESVESGTGSIAAGGASNAAIASSGSKSAAPISWKRKAAQTGGRAASLALHYGAKTAGTVAGTSIGLMAGNPLVGAVVGAKVGGMAGKSVEHMARGGIAVGKGAVQGIQMIQQRRQASQAAKELDNAGTGIDAGSGSSAAMNSTGGEIAAGSVPAIGASHTGATHTEAGLSVSAGQMPLSGSGANSGVAYPTTGGTVSSGQPSQAPTTTSGSTNQSASTNNVGSIPRGTQVADTPSQSTIPSFLKQRPQHPNPSTSPVEKHPSDFLNNRQQRTEHQQLPLPSNNSASQHTRRPVQRYSEASEAPLPEPPPLPEESQEPRKRHPGHYNYDL